MSRLIDAWLMRGGTSRGLFLRGDDLPASVAERDALLLRAMGSPDPYRRQIDGLGGATSSTSKVVLLWPSRRPGLDVEYLFGQVSVDRPLIDWSGNCGNLMAAVAPRLRSAWAWL
jgi:2-methylaconitate cis-trans-isomerase PrpF